MCDNVVTVLVWSLYNNIVSNHSHDLDTIIFYLESGLKDPLYTQETFFRVFKTYNSFKDECYKLYKPIFNLRCGPFWDTLIFFYNIMIRTQVIY
jgi:hypothetical protein